MPPVFNRPVAADSPDKHHWGVRATGQIGADLAVGTRLMRHVANRFDRDNGSYSCRAMTCWQPKASSVPMALTKYGFLINSGTAVNSWALLTTATCPRLSPCCVVKALITCQGPSRPLSNERRPVFSSMAAPSRGRSGAVVPIDWRKPCSSTCGSTSEKMRRKVS